VVRDGERTTWPAPTGLSSERVRGAIALSSAVATSVLGFPLTSSSEVPTTNPDGDLGGAERRLRELKLLSLSLLLALPLLLSEWGVSE